MNAPVDAGLAAALATLGLRPDADARSVRRAYAQQVKQIDQATQLHAFQELREAYELALRGIARQEAQTSDAAPTPEVEPSQPSSNTASAGFAPPDSAELARAVFLGFAVRADAGFKDEAEATSALQDALADDRLLNLEARTLFELQVAHRIMNGWQPGHEFLFGPACAAFHWESDRGHLRAFGQLGAALDAAINEKLIFFRQTSREFNMHRDVIRRLRDATMPAPTLLNSYLMMVQMLVQRYPNWLRLVTSQDNINAWFRMAAELPPAPPQAPPAPLDPPVQRGFKLPWFLGAVLFLMVLKALTSVGQRSPPMDLGTVRPPIVAPAAQPATNWPPSSVLGQPSDTPFGQGAPGQRPSYELLPTAPAPAKPLYDLPPPVIQPLPAQNRSAAPPASAVSVNAAAVEQALQAAITLPRPPPVSTPTPAAEPEAVFHLGHVSFALVRGQVLVHGVGPRTRRSFGTLQVGDQLLRCMSGDYQVPLTQPAEAQHCIATNGINQEPGVTPYMFRVWRNGQSISASLTTRDAEAATP